MATPGFNAAEYLVSRHVAAGDGERIAVLASETLTYAELDRRVGVVAAGLRSLGLHRDDRVMLVMSDEIPMLTGILGAFRAGVVAVPVSTMLNGSELGKIMADSGARTVLATAEFADAVSEGVAASPQVETVVLAGAGSLRTPDGVGFLRWEQLLAAGEAGDQTTAATIDDAWALWLYTSGTTGLPKAAMHRHANIRHVCETYANQVLGITPDDTTFSIAKMFFAYGIGNTMFFPLSVGAKTVLEPRRPSPDVVAERLEQARPTLFFGVPTFYAALTLSHLPDDAFSSVRMCASAGEPLPAPLQKRFTDRFGVEILDGIGSTEALHIFLSNRPGDIRPGTTGIPVPGYDLQIRDAAGNLVADDEPGALHVRGESIALGYWHRTDDTRSVFQGEWLSTGDTYVRNSEGYYTCLGRNGDMLKAGGIWVSPTEVESRLLEHPNVREAAVVGVPDADGLDKPVGVVVAAEGTTERELVGWCRDGLAHFKAPRQVIFVDHLPKTATGKLQRFKVRTMARHDPDAEPATPPGPGSDGGDFVSFETLASLPPQPPTEVEVDVLIVGAGPVGLFGAYYAGARGLSVAVVDSLSQLGGQVTAMYPEKQIYDIAGLPAVSGRELVKGLVAQANQYEPTYLLGQEAQRRATGEDGRQVVTTGEGTRITCGAIVLTGGIGTFTPRKLPAGEEFLGRGLDYFVPDSSGYAGKDVLIVGGGDSAIDWCLMLEPLAASVTLVHRRAAFRAHEASVEQVRASGVKIITNAEVNTLDGGATVEKAVVQVKGGEAQTVPCHKVVAALGFTANLGPLREWGLELHDNRHIVVDTAMRTNLPGVFSAGDITDYDGKVRLIAVGFGEVATAVNNAAVHIDPDVQLFPGHSTDTPHSVQVPA